MAKAVKCFVCKHENRKAIDKALKDGVSQSEIVRTLCPDIKKHSVQRHFAQDHHLQEPGAGWTPVKVQAKRAKHGAGSKYARQSKASGREDFVTVHLELPRELWKKVKIEAVEAEVSAVELVREKLSR